MLAARPQGVGGLKTCASFGEGREKEEYRSAKYTSPLHDTFEVLEADAYSPALFTLATGFNEHVLEDIIADVFFQYLRYPSQIA
jgi:hypothetical protein